MKGNKSGVSIIPVASELISVPVCLSSSCWVDLKNGEVDFECSSIRYRETAHGLEPALWLVGGNCLSLGRSMFNVG